MADENRTQVPILSFDREGKPVYMFKDWDDHYYFDICHYTKCSSYTKCFEEAGWMEPWEEVIKKKRKPKKHSASPCRRLPNRDD